MAALPSGPAEPRIAPADALALGATIALTTGLLEAVVLFVRRNVIRTLTFVGWDAYWLRPLTIAFLFAPLVAALGLLAWGARRNAVVRSGLFVILTLGTFDLLFLIVHRRLALAAQLMLAAGLAATVMRAAAGRLPELARRSRWPAISLAAVVMLMPARALRAVHERLVTSHLPAARGGAPNVLLIILDTVRAASLALYGGRPPSGGLERMARRGVVFDRAYATASWTLPSHASLFTGVYPTNLQTNWLHGMGTRHTTLGEVFQGAGYHTAGFTANLWYTSEESGLARGFQHYEDYLRTPRQAFLSTGIGQLYEETRTGFQPPRRFNVRKYAPLVTMEALDWLATTPGPSFVFLNYWDAHQPFHPIPALRGTLPEANPLLEGYEESITGLDAHLDTLFARLEQMGMLRNTIVIVTADHGESVGEHGLTEHGRGLYVQDLHVPLLMFGPGIPAGIRIEDPVSLVDVGATIAELAGLERFPGHSLAPLWRPGASRATVSPAFSALRAGPNIPASWPVSHGDMQSIVDGHLQLIRRGDGEEELYDLQADPEAAHDLLADPSFAGQLAELRIALHKAESN